MELNWSTFVLEIVNFLVLVWILKRFFYRPVLDVIEQRQAAIEARLAEARSLHDEAEASKARYGSRLAEWESERAAARQQLQGELDAERARQLAALASELDQAREKARVAGKRQHAEELRSVEAQALRQAGSFAAALLGSASSEALEARLIDLLLDDLAALTEEKRSALRDKWRDPPAAIEVASAWALGESRRHDIESALAGIGAPAVPVRYRRDAGLIAGLEITIGSWVLAANVRDELRGFAEFARNAE